MINIKRDMYFLASYCFVLVSIITFIDGLISKDIASLSFSVQIAFLATFSFALAKSKRNIMYIFFICTIFLFLLSKVFVRWITVQEIYEPFCFDTMKHIYILLFLSFYGLILGASLRIKFICGSIDSNNSNVNSLLGNKIDIPLLQKIIKPFLITSAFCQFLAVLEKISFYQVGMGGQLRTEFSSLLPWPILRMSYIYVLVFCIFLATLPKKKDCYFFIIQYVIITGLKMFFGSRGDFVLGLMFVYVYFSYRDSIEKTNKEKWIGVKEKICAISAIPALIVLLVFVGVYRIGDSFNFVNFNDILWAFLESQGTSIDILGYAYENESSLMRNHILYLFGTTCSFFETLPIINLFTDMKFYNANTVERAIYGTSLGQSLYYIVNPISYLSGKGFGSSYIAEIYLAFGYSGAFVVNFILSYILNNINRYKFDNIVKNTLVLLFLQSLYFMPRSGFDDFVADFASITHILFMIVLWLIYKIKRQRLDY